MPALIRRTVVGFAQLVVALGVALFVPAGTLAYPQAWVYLFVFVGSSALITVYLWRADPRLLERRLNAGPRAEQQTSQRWIQLLAGAAFIGMLVVPALDRRFAWSHVPLVVEGAGDVLVAFGFLVVYLVFRENTFTAATIEVAADQTVISTGPYAIVRHPMYAGALVMLLATPLALGSWWGVFVFVPMAGAIVWRLLDEEKFLLEHLRGYATYRSNVRRRLVPGVW